MYASVCVSLTSRDEVQVLADGVKQQPLEADGKQTFTNIRSQGGSIASDEY